MFSSPRSSGYAKKFRLYYGGEWVKDNPSENWVGGDSVDIICDKSECKNLDDIDIMFRKHCNVTTGHNAYSYMIGGLRFELNNDSEVKFLWSHMPTSSDDMHHVYCVCKNQEPVIPPTEPIIMSQEIVIPSQEPPIDLSQGIDLGPDVSFSKYFEELTPTKVSTFLSTPKSRKGKKKHMYFEDSPARNTRRSSKSGQAGDGTLIKPIHVPYGSPIEEHDHVVEEHDLNEENLTVDTEVMPSWETLINLPIIQTDTQSVETDTQPEIPTDTLPEPQLDNQNEPVVEPQTGEGRRHVFEINFDQVEDDIGGEHPIYDSEADNSDYGDDSEDEEYEPEIEEEEEEEEGDNLEVEEEDFEQNEGEFLSNFREFSDKTFDCTEESITKEGRGTRNNEVPLFVGQEWKTMAECKQYLRLHAVKRKFEFRFAKNNVDKIIVRCKGATNCPWRCYVKRKNDGHTASCRTLEQQHACVNTGEVDPKKKNTMCNARWIAEMIESEMKLHNYSARDIVKLVWSKFNIKIKYWQAWSARTFALELVHGNYEESYMKIPELCRQIEVTNPGSVLKWAVDSENKFQYLCVSYKASLDGWKKGCRPIVGLDGCFLKGKYKGTCLVAIGLDGNNGMFPIGLFVCRKEDGENWDAFLEIMGPELKKHHLPLTIMSDRAPSLVAAIDKHLGGCNQRYCFRHIFKNMCKWWRGSLIRYQSWVTAEVYTIPEFENAIDELEKSASGTKDYLAEIGASMWARSHFGVECKSNQLTNNFTECFNNFILETRDKPICSMVIGVSFLIMKIMYDRKITSSKWDENAVVPRVKTTIDEYIELENEYTTQPIGDKDYCVVHYTGQYFTVNIDAHECTCREWQVTGVPCVHGVHLLRHLRLPINEYCHEFVKVNAYRACYADNIKPVPHEHTWSKGNEVVLPPVVTRAAGRPKTNRYKGPDELENHEKNNAHKCSRCGGFGHNKRSCQGGPIRGTKLTRGRVGRPPANGGNRGANTGGDNGGNSGVNRGGRGGRGRNRRGRGAATGRGGVAIGRRVTIERPSSIQVPTTRGTINIQLPPPPQPRNTSVGGNSKRLKTFHPPSKNFMP